MVCLLWVKQSDNRALSGEESPCIQGQAAGETPDDASRWTGPQKCRLPMERNFTGDGATVS